jgi:hypothetical protein
MSLSGLPRTTRAVAWALANYMNERGESAFPSVVRLCSDVGNERGDGPASKSTVIDALRLLEREGWLEKMRSGGGRGHTSEWHARVPEKVQLLHRSEADEGAQSHAVRTAVSRSLRGLHEAPEAPPAETETVQQPNPLLSSERVQSQPERVQLLSVKGAATAPEVEMKEIEVAAAGAEPVTDAAAALLDDHLKRLGCGPALRVRALADPLRSKAWLEVAQANAETNVAGYFRSGLDSGEWPSPRIDREGPKATRMRWAYGTSLQLELVDANAVIDDWPEIDDVDRQEMREWVADAHARADARKAVDAA